MSKRILAIVESLNLDKGSGPKANYALLKNLVNEGFDLTILHYSHLEVEIPGALSKLIKENRSSIFFFLSRIQRIFQRYTKIYLSNFFEGIFGFSFTFFNDTRSICKAVQSYAPSEFDMLITLSQAASYRPHYAINKIPQWHEKWIAYIHDPYPYNNYPAPYRYMPRGVTKMNSFFKELSRNCSYAAFPSLLLAEHMSKAYPYLENKIVIIPHQISMDYMNFNTSSITCDPYYFNLVHAGSLLGGRSPKNLVLAIKKFLVKRPKAIQDLKLHLVGPYTYYQKFLEAQNSENILLYAYMQFNDAMSMQMSSTVNIILEAEGDFSPFLPGKFPHCIMANKPILVISPPKSELNRIMINYEYSADSNDIVDIADKLEKLYDNWLENKSMRLERNDLMEYLSSKKLSENILQLFN